MGSSDDKRAERIATYGIGKGGKIPIAMPTAYMEDFADRYYQELDFAGTMNSAAGLTVDVMTQLEDYISGSLTEQRSAAAQSALEITAQATEQLNAIMATQFYSALDVANPRWREQLSALSDQTMDAISLSSYLNDTYAKPLAEAGLNSAQTMFSLSESLMRGEIPQDVKEQMTKGMAEQAWSTGATSGLAEGSFGSSLYQNLGLTSLQMMSLGAGYAGQANQLYGQTVGNLTSMQNNMYAAPTAMAQVMGSYMPGQVEVGTIFNQNMESLAPKASDVLNLFGTMAAGSIATQESNQQQYLSLLSGALSRYDSIASANASIHAATNQARMMATSSLQSAAIGAGGSIVGGAMAGAGAMMGG